MAESDNLEVVEVVETALNARDMDTFANVHAEDVTLYAPDSPDPIRGRDSVAQWYGGFVNAFPDMIVKAERLFAQGEWVCGQYAIAGTHTGSLSGLGEEEIPPTNKPVKISTATIYRVQNGKVTEVHEYYDLLGFMAQLGLSP